MSHLRRAGPGILYLASLVISGCSQALAPPPKVTTFDVTADWGVFTHDIFITSKHAKRLTRAEVTFVVTKEQTVTEFTRHWSTWRPGEQKKLNIPASGGPVQRVEISGTAFSEAELQTVELGGAWYWTNDAPD